MALLGVREDDIDEQFIQGAGPGGQKINKTSSCVLLKHKPTGIIIKYQKSRSRELNRYHAREELCARIVNSRKQQEHAQKAEQSRERQRDRKPSESAKKQMVEDKRRQTKKKLARSAPGIED